MNRVPRQLVLLRHGQSVWNAEGKFTGWADVGLTACGVEEAKRAARLLLDAGIGFDVDARTSHGKVRTDLDVRGETSRQRIRGSIAGGGAELRARTGHGDIRIVEAR